MATEHGAHVLDLKDSGKLIVGNKADVIVLENKFKTPVNLGNIYDQIVVHGRKEFVSDVFINGKRVLNEYELFEIDKKSVEDEMRKVAEDFWKFN